MPPALAERNSKITGIRNRVEPDISMDADPTTGMLVGETQTFPDGTYYDQYRIGGTSLSSPLFAGVMALADQAAGGPLGFVNPLLYKLARDDSERLLRRRRRSRRRRDAQRLPRRRRREEGPIDLGPHARIRGQGAVLQPNGNCTSQKVACSPPRASTR